MIEAIPFCPADPPPGPQAQRAQRQVQVVVRHDQAARAALCKSATSAHRLPGKIHKGLRLGQHHRLPFHCQYPDDHGFRLHPRQRNPGCFAQFINDHKANIVTGLAVLAAGVALSPTTKKGASDFPFLFSLHPTNVAEIIFPLPYYYRLNSSVTPRCTTQQRAPTSPAPGARASANVEKAGPGWSAARNCCARRA
jgi:hypothetical protein